MRQFDWRVAVFFGCWAVLALCSFVFFQFNKNAALKKRGFVWGNLLAGVAFLGFAAWIGLPGQALLLMFAMVVCITLLIFWGTKFCPHCGKTLFNAYRARFCDECGEVLGQMESECLTRRPEPAENGDQAFPLSQRLTDDARRVLHLAHEEARRLGSPYVGTDHLLLGLLRAGETSASRVLAALEVDTDRVRHAIENLGSTGVDRLKRLGVRLSAAEVEMLNRLQTEHNTGGELPQTPRAKSVIAYAEDEAHNLGHNQVSTEHILAALLREDEGVAAQVLMNEGLNLELVRNAMRETIGREKRGG